MKMTVKVNNSNYEVEGTVNELYNLMCKLNPSTTILNTTEIPISSEEDLTIGDIDWKNFKGFLENLNVTPKDIEKAKKAVSNLLNIKEDNENLQKALHVTSDLFGVKYDN